MMVVNCINCGKRRAMFVVNFKMRCPNCKYQSSRWDYKTEKYVPRKESAVRVPESFDLEKFRAEQKRIYGKDDDDSFELKHVDSI